MFSKTKHVGRLLLSLIIVISAFFSNTVSTANMGQGNNASKVYLPAVHNMSSFGFSAQKKLLGIYMEKYWTVDEVSKSMTRADSVAGKKHTVSGWFIGLQNIAFSRQADINTNNFVRQMEALWGKGYISFVNIASGTQASAWEVSDNCPFSFSAKQVANGSCDRAIQKMADLYKSWVDKGGGRRAFIAPLPEMNGVNADGSIWTSYGGDSANFKAAYKRFVDIFTSKGIRRDQIWWVFAPNGWSSSGHEFENYYPGDSLVDVVGFSSYNYGFCYVAAPWQRWENYDTLYAPYLARIYRMAPKKSIIIAQTGTTAERSRAGEVNVNAKNAWLRDNYTYLSKQPQVLGILYFDIDKSPGECNWEVSVSGYTGYKDAAALPAFQYLSTQDLSSMMP